MPKKPMSLEQARKIASEATPTKANSKGILGDRIVIATILLIALIIGGIMI